MKDVNPENIGHSHHQTSIVRHHDPLSRMWMLGYGNLPAERVGNVTSGVRSLGDRNRKAKGELSHEKILGWLDCIGDDTTQLFMYIG